MKTSLNNPTRRRLILLSALMILAQFTFGQLRFTLKEADNLYESYHYASAVPLYEAWLKSHPNETEVKKKLAESYRKINDSKNGERVYQQLVAGGTDDKDVILYYAEMLAKNGKYDEAVQYYKQYVQQGGDVRGKHFSEALTNLSKFYRDSSFVTIKYLTINSLQSDFSPAFYKNGLVYCSSQIPQHGGIRHTFNWNHEAYLDVYMIADTATLHGQEFATSVAGKSKKIKVYKGIHSDHTYLTSNDTRTLGYYHNASKTDTTAAQRMLVKKFPGGINTRYHEGPLVFFHGEDSMIFTRNNFHKGKYNTDKEGTNRLKLFIAKKLNDEWSVREFVHNSHDYSTGHPALSPDNKVLYFASDMPGGKGGSDIWYCNLTDSGWSAPVNLLEVNTSGEELFPFIDSNGNIFFASNGWAGLGGLDIFYARRNSSTFGQPVNVGYPINSMKDDFGLIINADSRTGYFSSSRNTEKTSDDIFYFNSEKILGQGYSIHGLAMEQETRELIAGAVVVLGDENGAEIARTTTGPDASFSFEIEPEKDYSLSAEKEAHFPFNKKISTAGAMPGDPLKKDVFLLRKGVYSVSCIITDRKSGNMLDSVKVTITNMDTNTPLVDGVIPGQFKTVLDDAKKGNACNLLIKISQPGYLARATSYHGFFDAPGELKLHEVLDLKMDKIDLGTDIGALVKINPIYFDLGKAIIRRDAATELDKIVRVMQENPGMKIELGSHTDARGSDESNFTLSDKRAKASAAYIVSKGIAADRITGRGYGESRLVNRCENGVKCSEAEHQLNRRTEFLVTELGK